MKSGAPKDPVGKDSESRIRSSIGRRGEAFWSSRRLNAKIVLRAQKEIASGDTEKGADLSPGVE